MVSAFVQSLFSEHQCPDPDPPTDGGSYNWYNPSESNKTAHFGMEVTYKCGEGKKFQRKDGSLYLEKTLRCEWNQTWSPYNEVSS